MKKRASIGGDLLRRVECYPTSNNETTLCIQVVNTETGAISECINERPNKNFLWMRQKPVANTPGPGTSNIPSPLRGEGEGEGGGGERVVFAIGKGERAGVNNRVVKITEDEGTFMVWGDWNARYKHEEVNAYDAKGIVYSPSPLAGEGGGEGEIDTGILSLNLPSTELHLHEVLMLVDWNFVAASFERREEPDTREYTVLKLVNDKVMFGTEPEDPNNLAAKILDAYDTTPFDSLPGAPGWIEFATADDATAPFKRTITFDLHPLDASETREYVIVVFEDEGGNCKLRMSNGAPDRRFGGDEPIGRCSDYDFRDLQIYHENSSASDYGKALLLASNNTDEMAVVSFNRRSPGAPREIDIQGWLDLGTDKNPQAFVLNTAKTKAYVINQGGESQTPVVKPSITVLNLKNADGTPRPVPTIEADIPIENYFPSKELAYKPTHLAYHATDSAEFLVVGAEEMKGSVVIPTSSLVSRSQRSRPAVNLRPLRELNLESIFKTLDTQKKIPAKEIPKKNPALKPVGPSYYTPVLPQKPAIQPKPIYTLPSLDLKQPAK